MFLHLCVILFTVGRGSVPTPRMQTLSCRQTGEGWWADPPPGVGQTPLDADTPDADTFIGRHEKGQNSLDADPRVGRPGGVGKTPLDADSPRIWPTSRRYAYYWNAYLCFIIMWLIYFVTNN